MLVIASPYKHKTTQLGTESGPLEPIYRKCLKDHSILSITAEELTLRNSLSAFFLNLRSSGVSPDGLNEMADMLVMRVSVSNCPPSEIKNVSSLQRKK